MTVLTISATARFRLDPARFGAELIGRRIEPCGFDRRHPGGFAAAVAARFADAWDLERSSLHPVSPSLSIRSEPMLSSSRCARTTCPRRSSGRCARSPR